MYECLVRLQNFVIVAKTGRGALMLSELNASQTPTRKRGAQLTYIQLFDFTRITRP